MNKKIIISAGGTGGHIYPGLAVAQALKNLLPDCEITFVGSYVGIEKDIIPDYGYPMRLIHARGFEKGRADQYIDATKAIFNCRKEAAELLKEMQPDIVIGTGGFTGAMLLFEAARQKIPTLIHEQNSYPGRANRLLGKMVDRIGITFESSAKYFPKNKIVRTGNPVREIFKHIDRNALREKLQLKPDQQLILATGGSQGAGSINRAMLSYIETADLTNKVIYLLTGEDTYQEVLKTLAEKNIPADSENLHVLEYSNDMDTLLGAADLVVSRAGATSISEIAAVGAPAILVPFPRAAGDHQTTNARAIADLGGAVIIKDDALSGPRLKQTIESLLKNPRRLASMGKAAGQFGNINADIAMANEAVALMA